MCWPFQILSLHRGRNSHHSKDLKERKIYLVRKNHPNSIKTNFNYLCEFVKKMRFLHEPPFKYVTFPDAIHTYISIFIWFDQFYLKVVLFPIHLFPCLFLLSKLFLWELLWKLQGRNKTEDVGRTFCFLLNTTGSGVYPNLCSM